MIDFSSTSAQDKLYCSDIKLFFDWDTKCNNSYHGNIESVTIAIDHNIYKLMLDYDAPITQVNSKIHTG